jgi:predicted nucleic acid-binding protein
MSNRVLVDTSVFVDFIKAGDAELRKLINEDRLYIHPLVVGELLLGLGNDGNAFVQELDKNKERLVLYVDNLGSMVRNLGANGQGVGLVDCYLLSACTVKGMRLYTRDGKLAALAESNGSLYEPGR